MQVEGYLCLTKYKYEGETHSEFFDCLEEENGRRFLMIPLHDFPKFSIHMLEYYPKDENAIQRVDHPEYQYACTSLVDLDAIEEDDPLTPDELE